MLVQHYFSIEPMALFHCVPINVDLAMLLTLMLAAIDSLLKIFFLLS